MIEVGGEKSLSWNFWHSPQETVGSFFSLLSNPCLECFKGNLIVQSLLQLGVVRFPKAVPFSVENLAPSTCSLLTKPGIHNLSYNWLGAGASGLIRWGRRQWPWRCTGVWCTIMEVIWRPRYNVTIESEWCISWGFLNGASALNIVNLDSSWIGRWGWEVVRPVASVGVGPCKLHREFGCRYETEVSCVCLQ